VLLNNKKIISEETLQLKIGGVYTLLVFEENGGPPVSKDPLFFYNSIIKSIDHLFSAKVTNVSHV
jgi:hypothetical protein